MRVRTTPFRLVMALTLGLILTMSQEGECRGLPPGLGALCVTAGATARMNALGRGPKSDSPVSPSPYDSLPPSDIGPPRSDMEPFSPSASPPNPSTPTPPPPTTLGPTSPLTPSESPTPPPPTSAEPVAAPLPSLSPGVSTPSPKPSTPASSPLESPHPSPTPQSPSLQPSTPPSPLAPPPKPSTPTSPPLESPHPSPIPQSPSPKPSIPPSPLAPPPESSSTLAPSPPTTSPPPTPSPTQPFTPSNGSSTTLGLQVGFYKTRCPVDIEALIADLVKKEFVADPTILPALLRMQFHDCFVHGCDASILVDGPTTEKTAGPNLSVRGFEFIDALKASVEKQCPDMVSCSDIIAIATQVVLKLGGGPDYQVETGRKDGLVSNADDVDLPSPDMTAPQSVAVFGAKNFTAEEMVVLLGCHTVGIAHCVFFQDRLYQGTTLFDPNMDPSLRGELIPVCPKGTATNNFSILDQNSPSSNIVDNSFFVQIMNQRGLLSVDQALARDPTTVGFVQQLASNATLFNVKLAKAMIKLQALEVLTGNEGQIRKVCSKINS